MKGYRTIITAIIVIIAGALQQVTDVVPVSYAPLVTQLAGVLMLALRLITTSPPLQTPHGDGE